MHYTGTIWRPPYEAHSLLLEVTAGCTHHKCKFCTLYADLPFQFKMSPLSDIEDDLKEMKMQLELFKNNTISRTFLTGANPFVLKTSRQLGYHGLTIGIETGDNEALKFMNKGYTSEDIIIQCKRLEKVGIDYNFFYLTGISGAGKGEKSARATAQVCNQLCPKMITTNMLTVYKNSELYNEMQKGNWKEETEIENTCKAFKHYCLFWSIRSF